MPRDLMSDNKEPDKKAADSAFISQTFEHLFSCLDLSAEHKERLTQRGLTAKEIKALGYKTWPVKRRELVKRVEEKAEGMLKGVPGFWRNGDGDWELAGKIGIAIPVRNLAGNITGVKIRVDKPQTPQKKYIVLSSNPAADKKTGEVKYPDGTAARVSVHYPLDKPKRVKTLRITEGELKADIATSLTDVYTISLPGVKLWRLGLDAIREIKPDAVLLAFDSDKTKEASAYAAESEKYVVGKACASLYLSAKEAGFKVAIEDWPEDAGKGIDDVLINGATDKIRLMEEKEAEEFCTKMLAAGIPEGWVYVVGVKRFYHTQTLQELDKEQFADRYYHEEKGNPALKALSNPAMPKVDYPCYMPNKPMLFEEKGLKYFNTWRSQADIKPKAGSVKRFLEHVSYMLPPKEEQDILLDWIAYNVQNPGKKIHWAIMLQGRQGTGKSYFGDIMQLLLGKDNVSLPTNEIIHEIYTAWQKSCQLVVIEELMARGRLELMNKLKPIITQNVTMIREMAKPAYMQANVFNLLMFTNHEDAIIIDETDRRYCVFFSPAMPKTPKYYEELWRWTESHGPEILDFFLTRDLSKFQPLAHAPMTAGKMELIKDSVPIVQAWARDAIEQEAWPFIGDLVSVAHLLECLPPVMRNTSPQALGKALRALGCVLLGQVKLSGGNVQRLWSVRRHEVWQSTNADAWAQEYERWGGKAEPGGNPLAEARPL